MGSGLNPPLVSVVLPTRNRRESLAQALDSLQRQTYRAFELWLVDDGSSDGTGSFAKPDALLQHYGGIPMIHTLTNQVCRGAAASRNLALKQASGEFIAFLDDDDTWKPEYLEQQVACLTAHPEAVASYANYVQSGDGGQVNVPDVLPLFRYSSPLIRLLAEAFIHSMSVFFCRRSAFEKAGLMDESLNIVHDWEWYARILMSGEAMVELGGAPLVIRKGRGGLVTEHREWYREEVRVLDRACRENRDVARKRQHIHAHRALFFARTALRRHDFAFALLRLAEGFSRAPVRTLHIAARRLFRNLNPNAPVLPATPSGERVRHE